MTRRLSRALLPALLMTCPLGLRGQDAPHALPEAWRHWRYSAPIGVPESAEPQLVRALVPDVVSRKALPFWPDLRVVDDAGREVPFVLHARQRQHSREQRDARLLDVTYQPGHDTRATVDLGADARIHNAIEIETPDREFFARVTVDVSNDGRTWRILQDAAPIYRFQSSGLEGNQVVRYVDNSSRYVRLRIAGGAERFPLQVVRACHEVEREAELLPIEASPTPDPAAPANESWWRADSLAAAPVSRVAFDVAKPAFHRPVRVRVSDDGETWRTVGRGEIYRLVAGTSGREEEREALHVDFPETIARMVRVEVVNRDDPPLEDARPRLLSTPRRVVFQAVPGARYRLVFGNPEGLPPHYELERVTAAGSLESAPLAHIGAVAENTGYRDPAPWTERHPVVLWGALGIAMLVLGTLAVRALRASGTFAPHTG
jgi:hypothetical protein